MAKRKSAPAETDDLADLREEVVELKEYIRVLIDVLDAVRDELQWITRNGLPVQENFVRAADQSELPLPGHDSDAEDAAASQHVRVSEPPPEPTPLPPVTDFDCGDAVEFALDGRDIDGEIVAIDPARNRATVMVFPSCKEVEVSLDILTRIEPDPLARDATHAAAVLPADAVGAGDEQKPSPVAATAAPPGKLF